MYSSANLLSPTSPTARRTQWAPPSPMYARAPRFSRSSSHSSLVCYHSLYGRPSNTAVIDVHGTCISSYDIGKGTFAIDHVLAHRSWCSSMSSPWIRLCSISRKKTTTCTIQTPAGTVADTYSRQEVSLIWVVCWCCFYLSWRSCTSIQASLTSGILEFTPVTPARAIQSRRTSRATSRPTTTTT